MKVRMRNFDEVQRAHDVLRAIVTSEVPWPPSIPRANLNALRSALDALCWVLEHEHNDSFAKNIERVEKEIERMGFKLRQI